GAPLYMSPDQGLGNRYDARSEVYSLGCVLFEALTGRPPFRGDTAIETLRLHAEESPPVPENLPAGLSDIILRCLAKVPESRFQSIKEMKIALERVGEEVGEEVEEAPAAADRISKQRRLYLLLGSVAVVAVVGALVMFSVRDSVHDSKPAARHLPDPSAAAEKQTREGWRGYQKEKNFFSTIPTEVVDKQFGWTGGKWQFKQIKKRGSIEAGGHEVSDDDFKLLVGKDFDQLKLTMESKATGSGLDYIEGHKLQSFWSMSPRFDDGGAARLADFPDLTLVKIHFTRNLTVQAFRDIARLPKLRGLELRSVKMPAGALEALSECRTLRKLMMEMAEPVVNKDLAPLTRLRHLRILRLNSLGQLDDGCMPYIMKMRLETLEIGLTGISDAGLAQLVSMKSLKYLGLSLAHPNEPEIRATTREKAGPGISAEGLSRFKRLRPDCKVRETDDLSGVSLF
ncbi:MAG: protein kinase, partial [Cyanobacteria bacterium HKST-UBA02]|nr:protein kinase [Cyanobacteria bacterium HKST-UBA02]